MKVFCVRVHVFLFYFGKNAVFLLKIACRSDAVSLCFRPVSLDASLFVSSVCPVARINVVSAVAFVENVHREHDELMCCAAAKEKDSVVVAEAEKFFKICLCLFGYSYESFVSVADFHNGNARASEIEKFCLSLLEDFKRKRSRTCEKVVSSVFHFFLQKI